MKMLARTWYAGTAVAPILASMATGEVRGKRERKTENGLFGFVSISCMNIRGVAAVNVKIPATCWLSCRELVIAPIPAIILAKKRNPSTK